MANLISFLQLPNFFFLGSLQLAWEKSKRYVYKEQSFCSRSYLGTWTLNWIASQIAYSSLVPCFCPLEAGYSLFLILMWGPNARIARIIFIYQRWYQFTHARASGRLIHLRHRSIGRYPGKRLQDQLAFEPILVPPGWYILLDFVPSSRLYNFAKFRLLNLDC